MKYPYDIDNMPSKLMEAVHKSVDMTFQMTKDNKYKSYLGRLIEEVFVTKARTEITANEYHAILSSLGHNYTPTATQVFNDFVLTKKKLRVFKGLGD